MNILEWETKEILITVKAYPNPSKKYQETTCVAGVSGGEWIRLYPINFRGLPPDKAFKKYELIKPTFSMESESFIPDSDSIEKVGFIDTRNDPYWEKRKEYLLPTVSSSGTRGQVPCPRNTEGRLLCVHRQYSKKKNFLLPPNRFFLERTTSKNNLYIFWGYLNMR